MRKKFSGQLEILQLIVHFALFTCAIGFATAPHIDAATEGLLLAQVDVARQKEEFWEQWLEAMRSNEPSKALNMVRSNRTLAEGVANDVGNHGVELSKKGDTNGALQRFQGILELYKQLGDSEGMAVTAKNIGATYLASGDCKRAMPGFGNAAELYHQIGYEPGKEEAAKGLANCILAVALPDESLDGIANLKVNQEGVQVIVIHPVRCLQIGTEVCEFYGLHEYAHVYLGHAAQNLPWEEGEIKADCWAATYGPRSSAMAAYNWFLEAPPGISPLSHKTNEVRAERIRACAHF